MMYRALLVFLIVINLGIAAWWALRAPPPQEIPIELPAGVPRLQLLQEVPASKRPRAPSSASVATTSTTAPPSLANATQCIAFGPYTNPAVLRRAHERLQPQVALARVREVPLKAPRAWRVFIAPFPTREAAQAVADRMIAAGLDDLLVMSTGPDRNGIALGRFGSEAAAQRRLAELQGKGFSAQVGPVGDVATQGWIDVAAAQGFDATRAAQDIAATQVKPVDCASLR
jgi:hypothetical protein